MLNTASTLLLSACVLVHGHDESLGLAAPPQGGVGEGCRTGVPEEYECDSGLVCRNERQGTFWTGTCVYPEENRGGEGERCRTGNDPCDFGLSPVWGEHLPGQAFSVPVCTCEYWLGASNDETANSDQRLGMPAPRTGGLHEACRDGRYCNSGLYCKFRHHDHSYWTGTCVRERQQTGGEGERCNKAPLSPCDPGLRCVEVPLLGVNGAKVDMCQRDETPAPEPKRGEMNGKCNRSPMSPCNEDNLKATYVPLLGRNGAHTCICKLFLGEGDDERLGARTKQTARKSTRLGMPAPETGGEGEPCRNGWTCDSGLYCKFEKRGSEWTDTCVRERQQTGGEGERCNKAPLSPCDPGLRCVEVPLLGVNGAKVDMCQRDETPAPEPKQGEMNGKCNPSPLSPCNEDNLKATNVPLLGQNGAHTCICKLFLGEGVGARTKQTARKSSLGESGEPRLGMTQGPTGGLNQPCDGNWCRSGLYCKYTNEGSWTSAKCVREEQPHGGEGQRCRSSGQACNYGLVCRHVQLYPHGSEAICERQSTPAPRPSHKGGEDQPCRDPPVSPCDGNLRCTRVAMYGPHPEPTYRNICKRDHTPTPAPRPAQGERDGVCNPAPYSPCNHNNLRPVWEPIYGNQHHNHVCHCQLFLGESANTNSEDSNEKEDSTDGPKLGMPAPIPGRENNACRQTGSPCDWGLFCHRWTDGGAWFSRCERPTPAPPARNCGGAEQRCCASGSQCNSGLVSVHDYEHLPGQAFSVPVCKCEYRLGESSKDDDTKDFESAEEQSNESEEDGDETSGPKLGMPAPTPGRENNPCRQNTAFPCDYGLVCHRWHDATAHFARCERPRHPPVRRCGGVGERCCASGCNNGLREVWEHLPGQALSVCRCQAYLGDSGAASAPSGN